MGKPRRPSRRDDDPHARIHALLAVYAFAYIAANPKAKTLHCAFSTCRNLAIDKTGGYFCSKACRDHFYATH